MNKSLIFTASVEDWDALYTVNVRGTFLCYKHAADAMIKQGRGGRIVGKKQLLLRLYECVCNICMGRRGLLNRWEERVPGLTGLLQFQVRGQRANAECR